MERTERLALDERILHAARGKFWGGFEWDWTATLTPRFDDYGADELQREFVDGFVRRLAWRAQCSVPWFAVTERSPGGVMHLHTLLAVKAESAARTSELV